MTRRSAKEYLSIRGHGGRLAVPFYRFPLTESAKSDQHELLLALDTAPNHVFYAAPRFHRLGEINDAWCASAVASRSAFISPSVIGSLDDQRHTVAFDVSNSWVCSEPRSIRSLNSREVLEKVLGTLRDDARPLRERLPAIAEELRDAERRGRERIFERQRQADREAEVRVARVPGSQVGAPEYPRRIGPAFKAGILLETPEPTPPATRRPKPLEPELLALREAADTAARVFDAQLIIVQPAD